MVEVRGLTDKDREKTPSCAIEGCESEDVRFWIGQPDGTTKYYCGDCPDSDFDKLEEMAEAMGEEVGEYDPGYYAIEMEYEEICQADQEVVWLVKAHNIKDALARADDNDYDHEIVHSMGMAQGYWKPRVIRKPKEAELEEVE